MLCSSHEIHRLAEAAQTSAVIHIVPVIIIEYSQLAVRVDIANIRSCVDFLRFSTSRSSVIVGYNQRIQPIIGKVTVILCDLSGTLGTVDVGDITVVGVGSAIFDSGILSVYIFALVLQSVCRGIRHLVVVNKRVDIGFCTHSIAVFYINVALWCADLCRGQCVDLLQEFFAQRGNKPQAAGCFLGIVIIIITFRLPVSLLIFSYVSWRFITPPPLELDWAFH